MNRPERSGFTAIGQPLRRKEDYRLLTGTGRFTDDFSLDGQAYAVMVRSPHPHSRIAAIDAEAARKMPGVLGVFTGADCQADGLKPIPHDPVPKTKYDLKLTGPGGGKVFIGPHALLPVDKVRHVGEAVAMVVAETTAQALDAAEAVDVAYEELPFVLDQRAALSSPSPRVRGEGWGEGQQLAPYPASAPHPDPLPVEERGEGTWVPVWDEVPDNVLVDTTFGDAAATDRAFAAAEHVVKMEFHVGRVTAVALEPRAALGAFEAATRRYTLYAGTGGAVRQKQEMACVLAVPPSQVRVVSCDVGGNFGSKNRPYVEYPLVLWASRKLGRPVKYTATRSEAFLSDYQGRDLSISVELALNRDGRFLAMRADNVSNVGARCVSLSPLGKGSALITGSYDIPVATMRARAVFTNTAPTQAYRSSGRPEVTYALERLVDRAALELGIDRVEIRRKNLVRPEQMPFVNPVGARYDSGTYEAQMDIAMRIADCEGFAARKKEAAQRGRLLGRGLANYVESSIGSPRERAEITVAPEGRVRVVIGTQPSGQGHETSFAQVLADLIGVPVNSIDIVMGDTDVVSVGGGSHSGRSMRHAATVMSLGAGQLIAKAKAVAAAVLETEPDQIDFANGRLVARGTNHTFSMLELASEAAKHELPEDLRGGLAVVAENEMHDPVFPNGSAVCEIEVDPETGFVEIARYAAVDDVGRCINPLIVHGQTHGAIAQGVGQALWEQCALDRVSGQPLCGSLMDYGMPRADTLPSFRVEIAEVLSPTNPLGIKAGGEGGTTPAPAVIVSAILDALSQFGVRDIELPATPQRIWQAIEAARPKS